MSNLEKFNGNNGMGRCNRGRGYGMFGPMFGPLFGDLTSFMDDDFFKSGSFAMDVKESDNEISIDAELPGFKKEDINIEFEDGRLTISAENKDESEDKEDNYVVRERHSGKIYRSVYLGDVEEDKISAKYENGILNIVVPKFIKSEKKRGINIE